MSDVIEQLERVNEEMFNRVQIYKNIAAANLGVDVSGIVNALIEEDWMPVITAAISELKQLRADVAKCNEQLSEAAEDISHLGGYASEYFQDKWKLKDDIAKYQNLAAALEAAKKGE